MAQFEAEVIMYVALGFTAAALIALLIGRLMWSLAVSVGRRRAQRPSRIRWPRSSRPAPSRIETRAGALWFGLGYTGQRADGKLDHAGAAAGLGAPFRRGRACRSRGGRSRRGRGSFAADPPTAWPRSTAGRPASASSGPSPDPASGRSRLGRTRTCRARWRSPGCRWGR